jgi:hypothetical protein
MPKMPIREAVTTKNQAIDVSRISVDSIINTTNLYDSHGDVHITGLWNKTLNERKNIYLLQEHKMQFDRIISDDVKAFVQSYDFKDLGFEQYNGNTEALVFSSVVSIQRNPFMFDQYIKGYVKNHSVGMQYVTMYMCIDSNYSEFKEEKDNWDKYISMVANKEDIIDGYFFAVTEAKLIEGSAVPLGSNWVTPTISVKESKPSKDTNYNAPPKCKGTQQESTKEIIKQKKFI